MPHNGLRRQIDHFLTNVAVSDQPHDARILLTRALDALGGPVVERRPEPAPSAPTPEIIAAQTEFVEIPFKGDILAAERGEVAPPVDEPQPVVDSDTYIVNDDQRAMLVGTLPE